MVKSFEQFPGAIPRNEFKVSIGGHKVSDWVMVDWDESFRADESSQWIQIALPFTDANFDYVNDILGKSRDIVVSRISDNSIRSVISLSGAQAYKRELLPMTVGGERIGGLDARNASPALIAVTFKG